MITENIQLFQELGVPDPSLAASAKDKNQAATENNAVAKNIQAMQKTAETEEAEATTGERARKTTSVIRRDEAFINFSLDRDEKEAIQKYMALAENPADESNFLTEEEYESIQQAAERITEAMDETIDRYKTNSARIDKAVSEWYYQLSNGNEDPKLDFIHFLREAAQGKFDH